MEETRRGRRGLALASVLALLATTLSACANARTTLPVVASGCTHQSSAVRKIKDVLTDSPPWQPADTNSTNSSYSANDSRMSDYYDSDLSGAPTHTGATRAAYQCVHQQGQTRSPQSMGTIYYTCWYQALNPGYHDIANDLFLGCTAYLDGGYNPTAPMDGVISQHKGHPVDGAGCWNSPGTVGDPISALNAKDTSIADINALWNGNKVIGWMYKGDDGDRFIQLNYGNQGGWSAGVSLGFVSGAYNSPGGYSDVYKWDGRLPPGTRLKKCFSGGKLMA